MKRNRSEKYLCHDELLYDLFNLGLDTAKYQIINDIPYLVNIVKKDKYEVGFKFQLPKKFDDSVEDGALLINIDDIINENSNELLRVDNVLDEYAKYMCLSNIEKYLINILLDKYFDNSCDFSISLKEIEISYRNTCLSKRNIVIADDTFNRYIDTLNSLCNKFVYVKTKPTFRKTCYGSNNIEANHRLLQVFDDFKESSNNIRFSYSFGIFGRILKKSKRYSTLAPAVAYQVSLKQLKLHLAYMYVARIIYIENGYRLKNVGVTRELEISTEELTGFLEDSLNPIQSNWNRYTDCVIRYLVKVLSVLKKYRKIYEYDIEENYERKEVHLSIIEKEREEWFEQLNEYYGEREEKIPNRLIRKVIIFLTENDRLYYQYNDMLYFHNVM